MFKDFKFSKRDDEKCERFGLRDGQMRTPNIHKNLQWQIEGEDFSFGFGDLSTDDLTRIAEALEPGERFLAWNEHHGSNWQQTDLPMIAVVAPPETVTDSVARLGLAVSFPHREKLMERRNAAS